MIKVLKFGGTSVGSAANMRRVAEIIQSEGARVTVLSAMSGTTDALIRISSVASVKNRAAADEQLSMLYSKYSLCINELLRDKSAANEEMEEVFESIRREAADFKPGISERFIVSKGELLTASIFALYLKEAGIKAELLYAPEFMHTLEDSKADRKRLKDMLPGLTADKETYFITQGFISTNHRGVIDNLGRGGSDYSAALIGAAIGAGEVQIWTDIDGMHNNDPRFVENTYPIRHLSFDEAAELAYFGAKILHPATIQPCKDKGIAVLLKNTMEPQAPGTRISDREDASGEFCAVAAKDGIIAVRIYSTRMLMAYGFLRRVFEVFEKYRTPIDMITTSEVAVSLTIDDDSKLDEIASELHDFGTIEIEKENTIICIVGHLGHSEYGKAAKILNGIGNIPLKMISYGASHRSIAILIETRYKREILQNLNDRLF